MPARRSPRRRRRPCRSSIADEPDLAFLYGTILTDGGDGANGRPSRNVCIFAGRQIDRSPTGSGVTARMALQMARREARPGDERLFESCTGAVFSGRIVREAPAVGGRKSVIVEVGGRAHQTGEARFRFDDDDPLKEGFSCPLSSCRTYAHSHARWPPARSLPGARHSSAAHGM